MRHETSSICYQTDHLENFEKMEQEYLIGNKDKLGQ